jgi:hypothetical protein
MELFIPSLAVLLLAGLIVFLILPRIGAPILGVLSVALLIYGVMHHIQLFGSEYRYATWTDKLRFYGPFVIIAGLILSILFYILFLFTSRGPSALPASNISMNAGSKDIVSSVTNAVVNSVKNATAAVGSAVGSATGAVTNAVSNVVGKNNYNANKGVLQNLGNILSTPNRR